MTFSHTTRPLSILYLCSIKARGGTGATAIRQAQLMVEHEHSVLFAVCKGSLLADRCEEAGVAYTTEINMANGFHPSSLWKDVKTLKRIVKEHSVDIVHVYRSPEYWISALARGRGRGRFRLVRNRGIVTPIRGHIFNKILHNDYTDAVACMCEAIAWAYRQVPGFNPMKIHVIHDGVMTKRFENVCGNALRVEWGLKSSDVAIVSVARLAPVKGHKYMLEAFSHLVSEHKNVKLILVGDGNEEALVKAKIEELAIGDKVLMLGYRDDIPEILAAADVFILTSLASEGSSRGTLEAMASSCPVISSDVGSLPDIVDRGVTGYLVPPQNVEALHGSMETLVSDSALRKKMGVASFERVKLRFTEEVSFRSLETIYRRVLGDRK